MAKKKLFVLVLATLIAGGMFAQIPGVVVSDFTSRARDVHEDDLVTVMEMFMNTLATGRTVNVIDRNVLEREMRTMGFTAEDWSDSTKTARLGEELNADYLVSGTMTQLGTSITFSISVRDIKTLVVIASDQKQYTTADVWDNSAGIPGQLSNMASVIASGISTEQNKRQQAMQAQLAQEQAERERVEAIQRIGQMLAGTWYTGNTYVPDTLLSTSNPDNPSSGEIRFNSNGTFSLRRKYWYNRSLDRGTGSFYVDDYSGSYILEGNTLRLTWSMSRYQVTFRGRDRNLNLISESRNSSSSGSGTVTVGISADGSYLGISGNNEFRGDYRKNQ